MKKTIRKIITIIGYLIFFAAGIPMFIFWAIAMHKWFGAMGIILAIVLAPGSGIFPIIFWIVEGVFPAPYFAWWGIGLIGLLIACLPSKD